MENFALILFLFALGYGLKRLAVFPEDSARVLNLFVIYISLPALILLRVPQLHFSGDLLIPIFLPWLMLAISAILVLSLSQPMGWDRQTTGALLLVVPLGNTSFLGIPMVSTFFGPEEVSYAILYDQLGSFLALATYGTIILALYTGGTKPSLMNVIKKIVTFPPFLALIIALSTSFFPYPSEVTAILAPMAESLVPVVMVAVGFQLKLRLEYKYLSPLSTGLLIKMIIAPLIALGIIRILHVDSMAAHVSIFESGMPPMVTAGALAIMGGLSAELTAAMIGLGLILSFITLPLLFQLLQLF